MAKVEKNWVLSKIEKFLFSEKLSDVTFVFEEGKLIYAHAHHLAFVSEVFETQLFGAMQERRIEIKDATFEDFQTFLRFLYTGELQLTLENMFQLAYLGKKYMITKVTELAATFFKNHSNSETHFWKLFRPKEIEFFENEQKDCLARLTLQFEKNPLAYFGTEQFLSADEEIVGELVRNEKLEIKEFDLYKAMLRWAEHQCKGNRSKLREKVESFIHALRLPTLSWADLTSGLQIATNDLFSQEEKQSLLCYYGGMYSVPMPFNKMPRQSSLDVFVAASCSTYRVTIGRSPIPPVGEEPVVLFERLVLKYEEKYGTSTNLQQNELRERNRWDFQLTPAGKYYPKIGRPRSAHFRMYERGSSTWSWTSDPSSTPTSTTFVPQAAYRLVGVTCCIESSKENLQPSSLVSFELLKLNQETQKEESICTFGKGSVRNVDSNGYADVVCPVEELYQLLPNTTYTLRATPGPDVQIYLYYGSFTNKDYGTKCLHTPNEQERYGIYSFSLLPA